MEFTFTLRNIGPVKTWPTRPFANALVINIQIHKMKKTTVMVQQNFVFECMVMIVTSKHSALLTNQFIETCKTCMHSNYKQWYYYYFYSQQVATEFHTSTSGASCHKKSKLHYVNVNYCYCINTYSNSCRWHHGHKAKNVKSYSHCFSKDKIQMEVCGVFNGLWYLWCWCIWKGCPEL